MKEVVWRIEQQTYRLSCLLLEDASKSWNVSNGQLRMFQRQAEDAGVDDFMLDGSSATEKILRNSMSRDFGCLGVATPQKGDASTVMIKRICISTANLEDATMA